MSGPDLVSILIPCYNARTHVGSAIESAMAQTHRNVEVLVLDDGSTDGSVEVIRQYARFQNFRFESGPNRGGNAARNRLIELAQGAWVQMLDADDYLLPTKVERCLGAVDGGVDMAFCDYVEVGAAEERRVRLPSPEPGSDLLAHFIRNNIQTSAPLHRRRHLLEVGGFDAGLRCCQEYELHTRLARKCWRSVVHIPEPLYRLSRLPGSVSANSAKVFAQAVEVLEGLATTLDRDHELTRERATALALALEGFGRSLARSGARQAADRAIAFARRVSPYDRLEVPLANRVLSSAIGPVEAELALARIRKALAIARGTGNGRSDEG